MGALYTGADRKCAPYPIAVQAIASSDGVVSTSGCPPVASQRAAAQASNRQLGRRDQAGSPAPTRADVAQAGGAARYAEHVASGSRCRAHRQPPVHRRDATAKLHQVAGDDAGERAPRRATQTVSRKPAAAAKTVRRRTTSRSGSIGPAPTAGGCWVTRSAPCRCRPSLPTARSYRDHAFLRGRWLRGLRGQRPLSVAGWPEFGVAGYRPATGRLTRS
jgi:hypothetical protein